jgi:hypothetical protein
MAFLRVEPCLPAFFRRQELFDHRAAIAAEVRRSRLPVILGDARFCSPGVDGAWTVLERYSCQRPSRATRTFAQYPSGSRKACRGALHRLLSEKPKALKAITRFNLADFAEGVSDIAALRRLLASGGTVRGVRNLHAKMYLFGSKRAIVTSANLTEAALNRNHEFGLISEETEIVVACRRYFDNLWMRSGADLTIPQLDQWDETVTRHRAEGGRPNRPIGLGDFGVDAGMVNPPPTALPIVVADAPQAFVKFLGEGDNRVPAVIFDHRGNRANRLPLGCCLSGHEAPERGQGRCGDLHCTTDQRSE